MGLIQRIFCMMVIAMFSYNAGHSGGAVFTPEKLKEKARGAGEEALVLPKEVRTAEPSQPGETWR
jgi:hypothetical protein